MTVGQYKAFKNFHKANVKLSSWAREQDYLSPLLALLGAVLFVAWMWS